VGGFAFNVDAYAHLFGLLLGFAILSRHFEESGIPGYLPKWLPDDWKGPFFLLLFIFIISSFEETPLTSKLHFIISCMPVSLHLNLTIPLHPI